jgi:hypothetical protein
MELGEVAEEVIAGHGGPCASLCKGADSVQGAVDEEMEGEAMICVDEEVKISTRGETAEALTVIDAGVWETASEGELIRAPIVLS